MPIEIENLGFVLALLQHEATNTTRRGVLHNYAK